MKIQLSILMALLSAGAFSQYFAAVPYAQASDSPIAGNITSLENFEDGLLNTPSVTADAGGVVSPGIFTDSVDGDDGVLDGSGRAGRSWYSSGRNFHNFTFSGSLPTYVGIVVTDIGNVQFGTLAYGDFSFKAYDASNNQIGSGMTFFFGDGSINGETAEDRFTGVYWAGGISRIQIGFANSTDWEVDHLQYGAVPEPATFAALAVGLTALMRRRRNSA